MIEYPCPFYIRAHPYWRKLLVNRLLAVLLVNFS